MLIGVTFIGRNPGLQGGIELSLFASYREAWYNFSIRNWQFLYFNILMFVPFGILFPLLHQRFRKVRWTIGMAALFTLTIETLQSLTGLGIFDADDLFNNLLGAVIGYGLFMGMIALKERTVKRVLLYFSPLLLVIVLSGSMFTYYHLKEFGNLDIVPVYKKDMTDAKITVDVKLNENKLTVPVYKAPSYTKEEAEKFATDFFHRLNIDTSNLEVVSYPETGIYSVEGYGIFFEYIDGSYSFISHNPERKRADTDEESLKEHLVKFGFEIPEDAHFQRVDTGIYTWKADKIMKGNKLIDGTLTVDYNHDDTVGWINNKIVIYEKVRDVEIKSGQEAYQEILDGKFTGYTKNKKLESLHIEKVELSYYLDSKGFYQPVYAFYGAWDGEDTTILIPGMQ